MSPYCPQDPGLHLSPGTHPWQQIPLLLAIRSLSCLIIASNWYHMHISSVHRARVSCASILRSEGYCSRGAWPNSRHMTIPCFPSRLPRQTPLGPGELKSASDEHRPIKRRKQQKTSWTKDIRLYRLANHHVLPVLGLLKLSWGSLAGSHSSPQHPSFSP